MLLATRMQLHPYLSSTFLWIHEWQLGKIYSDLGQAESAYDMVQNATMKEVEDGYIIESHDGRRLLNDDTLDDKADLVLMTPVESLLVLLPRHFDVLCWPKWIQLETW